MKKVLFVIAHQDFQDKEFGEPYRLLKEAGVEITIASSLVGKCRGKFGTEVNSDILVSGAKAQDYDAVVFIGGGGAVEYLDNPAAHKLAQEAISHGKILAAICMAPEILANAGVLQGKKFTCFNIGDDRAKRITAKGGEYVNKAVVVDGNVITGSGPDAALEFGQTILQALQALPE